MRFNQTWDATLLTATVAEENIYISNNHITNKWMIWNNEFGFSIVYFEKKKHKHRLKLDKFFACIKHKIYIDKVFYWPKSGSQGQMSSCN